jgi:hypothetical protein
VIVWSAIAADANTSEQPTINTTTPALADIPLSFP